MVVVEPRWLSADEQVVWRTYLEMSRELLDQLDRDLQAEAGIPHGYYEILVMLSEAPDRTLRMTDLAERTMSSRSRLSHAVDRLEELGWVDRRKCPGDRRGTFAVLTDAGFRTLEVAAPGHVESVRRYLFDQLTDSQVRDLGEIAARVRDHLLQVREQPAPSSS